MYLNKNILIIGLTGVGKTTIGNILSKKLNKIFFDSDFEIEIKINLPIFLYFYNNIENNFRLIEYNIIYNLIKIPNIIISIGGGSLNYYNYFNLNKTSKIIYIYNNIYKIKNYIKHIIYTRPLLKNNYFISLKNFFIKRNYIYKKLSNLIININKINNIKLIIKKIIIYIKKFI